MKIRIVVTAIVEYEVNADHYPDEASLPECLDADLMYAKDATLDFIDRGDTQWNITGELI